MDIQEYTLGNPNYDLVRAIELGDLDKIKDCLDRGADVNYYHPEKRAECVRGAVFNAHSNLSMEAVDYLLEKGFNTNFEHIFTYACYFGCDNLVQRMIEAGEDVNRAINYESPSSFTEVDTPIDAAADGLTMYFESHQYEAANRILRMLIDAGAKSDFTEVFMHSVYSMSPFVSDLNNNIDDETFSKMLDAGLEIKEYRYGESEGETINVSDLLNDSQIEIIKARAAKAAVEAVGDIKTASVTRKTI